MELNGTTLRQAIDILEELHCKAILSIEFEDGSGLCYNVLFAGYTHKSFCRLEKSDFL